MKTQSFPKFLLATAAVAALSGHKALAQNPAVAAPIAPIAAVGRSGAGAAQQDQISAEVQMAQDQARRAGNAAADASLTMSQSFKFTPPPTKTRLGLNKDEQEKLDQLGADLVSFVDEAENIENARREELEKLSEEAAKRKDEADQRLRDAKIANRDAATDLLGAKREEKRANEEHGRKWKERADITRELEAREKGNREISQENAERKDRIEKAKEEVSKRNYSKKEAEELLDKAKSNEKALEKQLDDNEKALASAKDEVAKSEAGLQKSKEGEKAAEDDLRSTIKTGEDNVAATRKAGEEAIRTTREAGEKAVDQARKTGESNLASAKDKAKDAAKDKAARDKVEKGAASAQRAAEKAQAKAAGAAKRAEENLLDAKEDVEAANKALAEARRKDKETKGWFSRLFIPSVEKAERRARSAEMAVGKAVGEKELADANAAKKAAELAQAGKKLDESREAAAEAAKNLKASQAAVAEAKKKLQDDVSNAQVKLRDDVDAATKKRDADVAGARKKLEEDKALKKGELDKARQGVATAEGVLRDSRNDEAKKKGAVEDTKDELASATREVGRSEKVVEKRGGDVEKAEAELKGVAAEGGNPLEFANPSELKDQVQNLNHEIRELQDAKDKAEQTVREKDAVLKRSEDGLAKAKEAFSIAEANLNGIGDKALAKATQAEEDRQGKIEANANDFWNKFMTRAERDATGFVNADPGKLRDDLDAAANALKAREADLQKAETDYAEAKKAFGAAEKAVDATEKVSKSAIAAAKDDAEKEKAQKDGETAIADARTKVSDARKALTEAEKGRDNAKRSRDEAKAGKDAALKAANSYEGEVKDARRNVLSDAEKLKKAFYAAVEEAREARREEKRRRLWSDSRKRHMAAIDALNNYRKAKKDYADAEKEYEACVHEARDVQKMAGWKQNPDVAAARKKRIDARAAFKNAEAAYNQFYSDANTFRTASTPDDEALQIVKRAEARFREDYGKALEFDGDRLWLARTSVNGISLMESFFEEMEWQEENDENVANAAKHAEEAARYVRERAIYGGFYFAGLDVSEVKGEANPETGEASDKLVVFVDKGRFGPTDVYFVAPQANGADDAILRDTNGVPVVDGRAFRRSDIISRFVSRDAGTNDLERQAFNFIEFRKNFNALNADPDIRKANVEFSVARPDFDYDYDYGETNARPARTSRAILTKISVDEDPNLVNRILPRPIAPIHGVLAVDNFNSMGATDSPIGEADTWMARLTLQNQHRFLDRDAALTLNGNYSLGGSLYGGAANYFVARKDELGWSDGGWRDWAFTVHGGYTDVDQTDVIEGLDVLGTGYYGGLQASTRLVDTVTSALDFSLGLTYRYVENAVRIEGEEIRLGPNGGDGYTILPLSAAIMYADKQLDAFNGRNYATVEAVYNLGGSNADELQAFRSAIEDDSYIVLRAQLARIQLLGSDSTTWWIPRLLFARADAQWASTPVIGAEQYGLGGHGTVRGYVEREFMGDSGASGTVEFRTPINLLSIFSAPPDNPYQAGDKLQLVYFADAGWFNQQDGLGAAGDDSEFIASIGLGLRYAVRDLIFRFDWGFPLVRDDDAFETSSAGVGHLSLQYQF